MLVRRLSVNPLEDRTVPAPFGAAAGDTDEFMLGSVYVQVVLFESNGSIDANTENWTPALIQDTKTKVTSGLQWWVDTLAKVTPSYPNLLNFNIDFTYADAPIATGYEPISHAVSDRPYLVDYLTKVGAPQTGNSLADVRAYNHTLREANNTDWAFTAFMLNSTNAQSGFPGGPLAVAFNGVAIIVPSHAEDRIVSHESGHVFYAVDEYAGGSSYNTKRGYYNTQNLNGIDDAPPGFVQANSIMAAGTPHKQAFANHTSAPSTLAMIGWQDADTDGIFDVLDVPFTLTGSGAYNPTTGLYRWQGTSQVGTLDNLNPAGLGNDITINKIRVAEYRLDGGAWQTGATFKTYNATLDLSIPVTPTTVQVEIRTRDTVTGATSPIVSGTAALVVSTNTDTNDGNYTAGNLSLREAVALANASADADTITFAPSMTGKTITLSGSKLPSVVGNLTISGPGAGNLTITGNGASRHMEVSAGANLTVSGLTFTGGSINGAGGSIVAYGPLTATDCEFVGNQAKDGGVLWTQDAATFTRCTFTGNTGTNFGGAITTLAKLTVQNCTFSGNNSNDAGAIWTQEPTTITGSTFVGNTGTKYAGAIDTLNSLTLTNCTFSANTSNGAGGAIWNQAKVTATNCTFTLNRADADGAGGEIGGAIWTQSSGPFTLVNTIVSGNLIGSGAGTPNEIGGDNVQAASSFNLIGHAGSAGGLTKARTATSSAWTRSFFRSRTTAA